MEREEPHWLDPDYHRWREDQGTRMDADYRQWRRERFARDFAQWHAIRVAQRGLRTGSGPPITHEDRERELSDTWIQPGNEP